MRENFNNQLSFLNDELTHMGILIESAISNSVKALLESNERFAHLAINYENEIDRKEKDIENLCMKLLLTQQPVANDLRIISAALKMITDMERIGDQAADIAEITLNISKDAIFNISMENISKIAVLTINMVNDSIDAFIKKNPEFAKGVIKADDRVDEMFDIIKKETVDYICMNRENSHSAADVLMIAKYFERIGDHAVNIAEWVIYSVTGEKKGGNV